MMRSKPQKELLAEAQTYSGHPELAAALVKKFDLQAEDYRQTLGLMLLVGGEEAIKGLKAEALNPKRPPDRRNEVLLSLGKLGDAGLIPALRPLLKDKEPPVRAGACAALAALGDAESLKVYVALFKDAAPAVRLAALRAVNRLKLAQARENVKPLLDDPDPKVREVAGRVWNALQKEAAMSDPVFWFGHDTFLIQAEGKNIYFDPFQLPEGLPKADVVFLTHDHHDHLSPEDLRKVSTEKTLLVIPRPFDAKLEGLPGKPVPVSAGDKTQVAGLGVQVVPSYNPAKPYHPKVYGGVGYIVTVGKTTYYHAGDTDRIPEMKDFPAVDVAFLPVSGTYVMTAQEAAEATKVLKCGKAIPMHYGAIIGSEKDAEEFRKSAACPVEILPKTKAIP
jgi:L-ascorbate metabolism protein UlaG (beta-lactamase superfamily)